MGRLITALGAAAALAWAPAAECGSYADANRELFVLPASSGVANSDLAMSRNAAPTSSPANLALDSATELTAYYANHLDAFSTSMVSVVREVVPGVVAGLSLSYLLVPDILITTDLQTGQDGAPVYDPARLRYESASDVYGRVAFGYRLYANRWLLVGAGAALNIERRSLLEYRGYGIGMDAGVTAGLRQVGLNAAVNVWNLTSMRVRWSDTYSDRRTPTATLAVGWRRDISYIYGRIQLSYRSLDFFTGNEVNSGGTFLSYDSPQDLEDTLAAQPRVIRPGADPLEFIGNGSWGAEYSFVNEDAAARLKRSPAALNTVTLRGGLYGLRAFTLGAGLEALLRQGFVVGTDLALVSGEAKAQEDSGKPRGLPDTYRISLSCRW